MRYHLETQYSKDGWRATERMLGFLVKLGAIKLITHTKFVVANWKIV